MYEQIKTRLTKKIRVVIKGINTWAVSILRYSVAFIDWTKVGSISAVSRVRSCVRAHFPE